MVRKRPQAHKSLSPEDVEPKKPERRKSSNSEDVPSKKMRKEEQHPKEERPDNKPVETNETKLKRNILQSKYDELPEHETFPKELTEKGKAFWSSVQQDYHDFSNWTTLLQHVSETEDNMEAARATYNCFLRYYPYCYGYWKKFADLEKKNGDIERAKEVCDRGVEAIPVSIDLWVYYINLSIQQNKGNDGQSDIRKLFKRAVGAAGLEFKSTKLWDMYIEWEKSLGNLKNVTEIFDHLISTPTQQYIKNWQKFKSHLETYSPGEILPAKEYGKLMKDMDAFPPGMVIDEEKTTGEEDQENNAIKFSLDEDDSALKETYVEVRNRVLRQRESLFKETAQKIVKRWKFEESIKRPYFHVKPLEKSQIKNWKDYLDFEIKHGDDKRIIFLFERCMVVCALYEVFWEKYLNYIENKDVEQTRSVFTRACNVHLMKKYKLHLRWAAFEERQNNFTASAQILQRIDHNFPGMIMITQRRVGLARRMHDSDEMVAIYEKAIEAAERIEDKIFYSIKFSHVLVKHCNKKAHARDVLWSALKLGKKHKRIYLQLLDLETHYGGVQMEFVKKLFDSILNDMSLDNDFRGNCAQRKVEFYQEYGDDIDEIIEIEKSYRKDLQKQDTQEYSKSRPRKTSDRSTKQSSEGHRQQQNQEFPQQQSSNDNSNYASWYPPNPPDQQSYDWQQHYAQYSQYNKQ